MQTNLLCVAIRIVAALTFFTGSITFDDLISWAYFPYAQRVVARISEFIIFASDTGSSIWEKSMSGCT